MEGLKDNKIIILTLDYKKKRFHLSNDFKKHILSKVKERNSKTSMSAIGEWSSIKSTFNLEDKDIEDIIENTVISNEKNTWEEIWNYCISKYKK